MEATQNAALSIFIVREGGKEAEGNKGRGRERERGTTAVAALL